MTKKLHRRIEEGGEKNSKLPRLEHTKRGKSSLSNPQGSFSALYPPLETNLKLKRFISCAPNSLFFSQKQKTKRVWRTREELRIAEEKTSSRETSGRRETSISRWCHPNVPLLIYRKRRCIMKKDVSTPHNLIEA